MVVGTFEAKTHLAQLLKRVEHGETITVTRHGMAVARIVPALPAQRRDIGGIVDEFRNFRKGRTLGAASIRKLVEAGRRF